MAQLSLANVCTRISVLVHLAMHHHYPRVLANSMPKAGTHLLTRLLELLHFREVGGSLDIGPNEGMEAIVRKYIQQASDSLSQIRPGCFSKSHMYFYQEILRIINENQLKTITIVRDPRDVCVSDAFHILKRSDHRLHPYYSKMSEDERLMASIVGMSSSQLGGDPPSSDIGFHYRHYLGWVKDGAGLVVKFEDLVGERGGGTDQAQMETVTLIERKSRMPQIRGVEGEAVVNYAEPLTTL